MATRKMRRTREVAGSSDAGAMLSGYGLYDLQGDAKAALDVFSAPEREGSEDDNNATPSLATLYNTMLLRHVVNKTPVKEKDQIITNLEEMEKKIMGKKEDHLVSARKRRRNDMILTYNRALIFLAAGQVHTCANMCAGKLRDMIVAKQKPSEEAAVVTSRMTFLLLECLLALSVGRNSGLKYKAFDLPHPDEIVEWIDRLETEKDPQHKFLLTLFKSRLALTELDSSGKRVDSKVRAARKELKLAMEIFQHKLRPSFGADTGSVVSSANSEENLSIGVSSQQEPSHQPPPPSSAVLQRHNQSALSLKANLEQLKGNSKKSLILCSEALGAAKQEWTYQAVHENNLAVVYETNQKRHLALHALVKALQANTEDALFFSDGTARPDQGHLVLHNAAVCALQARNFLLSYECMATLCAKSDIFKERPRCWLRMAEACLGIFSNLKRQNQGTKLRTVGVGGEVHGVLLQDAMLSDEMEVTRENLATAIGSREDVEQVNRNPLLRARACLEYALESEGNLDSDGMLAARLNLAYVHLAFGEHTVALETAKLVLEAKAPPEDADEVSRHLYNRNMATARMYAAEASCALGEMVDAMKFLVGDGKDDAFDRLASDLGGVTLETASLNGKGKRRLAKAQTMVRTSASAVTAVTGNSQAAKQLANSANAMEDAYAANRERSSARRAMIYTLLREGQQSNALSLLLSLR